MAQIITWGLRGATLQPRTTAALPIALSPGKHPLTLAACWQAHHEASGVLGVRGAALQPGTAAGSRADQHRGHPGHLSPASAAPEQRNPVSGERDNGLKLCVHGRCVTQHTATPGHRSSCRFRL